MLDSFADVLDEAKSQDEIAKNDVIQEKPPAHATPAANESKGFMSSLFKAAPPPPAAESKEPKDDPQARVQNLMLIDGIMENMVCAIAKVKRSQGSIVSLPKAELDLLAHIEQARDFMMESISNQTDRSRLRETFGGDCKRIARLRAVCESIEFSDMNKGDQRLRTCLRACESVEKVVIDLGDGEALRTAHANVQAAIKASGGALAWGATSLVDDQGNVTPESATCTLRVPSASSTAAHDAAATGIVIERTAELVMALTKTDQQKLEKKLINDMAALEARVQEAADKSIRAVESVRRGQLKITAAHLQELEGRETTFQKRLKALQTHANELADRQADSEEELASSILKLRESQTEVEGRLKTLSSNIEANAELLNASIEQNKQKVNELSETIEGRVGKLETRCDQIEERTTQLDTSRTELEARLAAAEQTCATMLEEHKSTSESGVEALDKLAQRVAAVELRAEELVEAREHGEQLVEEAKVAIMEAQDNLRAEMQLEFLNLCNAEVARWQEELSSKTKTTQTEVEKLKKNMDLDPIWKSFAHVDSIIGPLQKRVDEITKQSRSP